MYGCRETDFKGDYEGKIAVLFRGACKFEKKIENAALKNATGVVVINDYVLLKSQHISSYSFF